MIRYTEQPGASPLTTAVVVEVQVYTSAALAREHPPFKIWPGWP